MLLLLFISFCELKTSRRGLEEAVNAARSDGIPVVSFASTDQAQLANAFLARADKIGLERAAVVALIDTRKSSDATECSDFDVDSDKCVLVTLRNADQPFEVIRTRLIRGLLHAIPEPLIFSDIDVIWRADSREIFSHYATYLDAGNAKGTRSQVALTIGIADLLFARDWRNQSHTLKHHFSHSLAVWYAGGRDAVREFFDVMSENDTLVSPRELIESVNLALMRRDVHYDTRQRDMRVGLLRLRGDVRLTVVNVAQSVMASVCPSDAALLRCNDATEQFLDESLDGTVRLPIKLKPPRVYMIHLPKSAGTSLSAHLRDLLGCSPPGFCCHFPGKPTGVCNETRYGTPCGLFGCIGHSGFHRDAYDFVVLSVREPLARACSAFHYPMHHVPGDTFEQHIRRPRYRNVLARMLSGKRAYTDLWPPKPLDNIKDIIVRYIDAVVTTEQFDVTLRAVFEQVSRRFDLWPTQVHDVQHSRVSSHDTCNVTASLRAQFERLNRLDMALYKFIVDRFVHQIEIDD